MCLAVIVLQPLWGKDREIEARRARVEQGLRPKVLIRGEPHKGMALCERMRFYEVAGVSVAVVNAGEIEWARGYGLTGADKNGTPVTEHTLFQAASISKPLTAFGALLLAQQGKIALDEDVNRYLKRWQVPENAFTKTEKVTLRRLLSHTAGTSVPGFSGYAAQSPFPGLVAILEGKKPAVNTDPVRVVVTPGTEWRYSGGGTSIVQLLIEDVTGERFASWMQRNVLRPLGMHDSAFTQPLPPAKERLAASGYQLHGTAVEGRWHVYPELAAAGLWTTPHDLARFMLYMQAALRGEKDTPLNAYYAGEMVTRQKAGGKAVDFGLGFSLDKEGDALVFGHGGQNEGFIARLSGLACKGQGVVIMMNNDSGWLLMEEITNSVADVYQWPGSAPLIRELGSFASGNYPLLAGVFAHGEEKLAISVAEGKLFVDFQNGLAPLELHPAGNCAFFMQFDAITIEFSGCQESPNELTLTDAKGVKTVYQRKEGL